MVLGDFMKKVSLELIDHDAILALFMLGSEGLVEENRLALRMGLSRDWLLASLSTSETADKARLHISIELFRKSLPISFQSN